MTLQDLLDYVENKNVSKDRELFILPNGQSIRPVEDFIRDGNGLIICEENVSGDLRNRWWKGGD